MPLVTRLRAALLAAALSLTLLSGAPAHAEDIPPPLYAPGEVDSDNEGQPPPE